MKVFAVLFAIFIFCLNAWLVLGAGVSVYFLLLIEGLIIIYVAAILAGIELLNR